MDEVMQIRAASRAAMIKQCNDSGLTIKEMVCCQWNPGIRVLLPAKPVEENGT